MVQQSLNLTVRKQPTNTVTYPKSHVEPVARPEVKLNLDEYQFLVLTLKLSIPYTGPEAGISLSHDTETIKLHLNQGLLRPQVLESFSEKARSLSLSLKRSVMLE